MACCREGCGGEPIWFVNSGWTDNPVGFCCDHKPEFGFAMRSELQTFWKKFAIGDFAKAEISHANAIAFASA